MSPKLDLLFQSFLLLTVIFDDQILFNQDANILCHWDSVFSSFLFFKGIVSLFSNDPSCKDGDVQITIVLRMIFFVKVLFLNFFFILRFLCEYDLRISRLIEAMEKFPKMHFPSQETNEIFHIFIKSQGYRCKSGRKGYLKLRLQSL